MAAGGQDLVKETAVHYKKARKCYDALAAQLVRQGHSLDVFACSLDQARPACGVPHAPPCSAQYLHSCPPLTQC